jgi:glycosyltransferase involved in cell wall biosynthesis
VKVFTKTSVDPDNQYLRRLMAAGVQLAFVPVPPLTLTADWDAKERIVDRVMRLSWPALLPSAVALALWRNTSYQAARRSMYGRWQGMLSRLLHKDRSDFALTRWLGLHALVGRPQVVHVFCATTAAVVWSAEAGCATIYSELTTPGLTGDGAIWAQRRQSLNRADAVIAVSKTSAAALRDVAGIDCPIYVVPPVVAASEDFVHPSRDSNGPRTITCIARLSPEKGLRDLLLAAASVLQQRKDVEFLVAGSGPDMASLVDEARRLGIEGRVRFMGAFRHDELPAIMARTDVFVLPSLTEGMPFAVVEAMAFGRPVVATNVGGIPELVSHGETGLLVPPRDPDQLSAALLALLDDPHLRQRMGEAARRRILSGPFSVEAFTEAHLAIYRGLLGSDGPAHPASFEGTFNGAV